MVEVEFDLDDCFHDMLLVSSDAVFLGNPGDFGVRLYGEYLLFPREANEALRKKRIRLLTVGDLFQYLDDSPQKIARALAWNIGYVRQAHWSLAHIVQGKIEPSLISFPQKTEDEPLPDLAYVSNAKHYCH